MNLLTGEAGSGTGITCLVRESALKPALEKR
jgi:hypothetical protein